ncbi:MAG: undecaprenyl-diphosphate phosphatase [Spirochaetaceae bacterium]|jgi:undecaprenyl-diphosphatase|nr:undecaprenyl-diphosphate phosphatase [Spirochaetaceae bacterium]
MSVFESIFLGLVQGITEFLPVSSSGHLVLFQKFLGITAPALFFDTLLHCGTLLAVVAALRKDVWNLIRHPFQRLAALLVMATVVTVVIALFFKDTIEEAFVSGKWLGQAFLATALALFISEYLSHRPGRLRNDAEMDWFDAVLIGGLQGIAIIPGVSRSGFTLSGALSRKLERDLAARFSFLLSIPAILGALVLQLKELYEISHFQSVNPAAAEGLIAGLNPLTLIAGTLTAALVGFGTVTLMLRIVRERSLTGFGVYTALLGLLILLDQHITHIVF